MSQTRQISAIGAVKGMRYIGRGDWYLAIEKVTVTAKAVTIVSLNGYGEERKERYRTSDLLTLFN